MKQSKRILLLLCVISIITSIVCDEKSDKDKVPTVGTSSITNITVTTATGGGDVIDDGGTDVTSRGVCWSTSPDPTIDQSKTTDVTGTGSFTSSITGLSPSTTYYVKAYATNSVGTNYGDEVSFTTNVNIVFPTVTTDAITNITTTSASCGGNVTGDGGAVVTARGVCWSTSQNPTIADNKTSDGTGTGVFTSSITGLSPNTTYYVRAYATNSAGTNYDTEVNVTTNMVLLSTITTESITNITATAASGGGNISSDGGGTISGRGVCWSTSQNPTIADSKTSDGSGTGSFISSITGLLSSTTYYVKSYATNSAGTSYGNQLNFITNPIGPPTVTTKPITNVTLVSASSGGIVTDDGGTSVTARGVCWSTSQNPTVSDTHTSNGTGIGSFTSLITGLTPGATYYVRAYTTNSSGTSYGGEISFTTLTIGDSYQGGKIFYILQPGDPGYMAGETHGLIAAPSDQSTGIQWYNGSYLITGAIGTAIGTGNANTNAIVAAQGAGSYAAKLCYDLVLGAYSDWYLPSKDELNKLYLSKAVVGVFADYHYWSSSESGGFMAEYQYFGSTLIQGSDFKIMTFYVRAVRAF